MRITATAALSALMIAAPVLAADKPKNAPPAVVQKLLDCRALTDAAARLACLDAGVSALASAVESRDVLVADKEEVKKARRGLFGLALPTFNLFGADKDEVAEGEKKDERGALTEIEAIITAARPSRTAGWRFVLDDGSTWLQTDSLGFRHDPKPGMKIRIRRAAMGSYLANVEGQTAVRVKRIVE
ncbi:hypothetical protein [Sandarakinorhabdus sp.]|uniref:hypothetical protein n=1 Tax=Sandarakinorhabdus sp. TaxID=1916663 RepID=UPI00286E6F2A|nr:hypothetical protein [Sandarakinorhabdus sp.]